MNLPIDTTDNGCAFALRVGYDAKCYAGNVGTGGEHYPATSVCVVYQLRGRMRDNGSRTLPQGGRKQSDRRDILNTRDGSCRDMGGMKC